MEDIKITVATPVYNREDCILRCVESVVSQNYANTEYWIVDDGSTDNTDLIIRQYADQYPFIRHHRFEKNQGVNAARNYAIQNSTNDFILLLDSDDYLIKNALQMINESILKNPGYLHYLFAQDDRMPYYNQNPILKAGKAKITFADFISGKVEGDFAHVVSASLMKQFPFDEYLRIYEDLQFFSILKAGEKQLFFKNIVVNRERKRLDSVSNHYQLTNADAIRKQYVYSKEKLSLFEADYIELQAKNKLFELLRRIYTLGVALGKYEEVQSVKQKTTERNVHLPFAIRSIERLRLGIVFRQFIFIYSYVKNTFIIN